MRIQAPLLATLGLLLLAATPAAAEPLTIREVSAIDVLRDAHDRGEAVVVLHLYAMWCPPCRGELPEVNRLPTLYSTRDLKLVAVSIDEDEGVLRQGLAPLALNFPARRLRREEAASLVQKLRDAGLNFEDAVPYTAVFDRSGRLVEEWSGAADLDHYRAVIERGLKAPKVAVATKAASNATTPSKGTDAPAPAAAGDVLPLAGLGSWVLPAAVGGGVTVVLLAVLLLLGGRKKEA